MKTHWKKSFNPDYLGAYSLDEGEERPLKIKEVKQEMVKGPGGRAEECTVAHFEAGKPMILNRTNCKIISSVHGSPYIEDWKGKFIVVFATNKEASGKPIKIQGEVVESLRVKPVKYQSNKEALTPAHAKWEAAKKAVQSGNATIEKIKQTYSLTEGNEKLLCSKSDAAQ